MSTTRIAVAARALLLGGICAGKLAATPGTAVAETPRGQCVAALAAELRARGEPEAEARLATAACFARAGALREAEKELEAARAHGVSGARADLVLADVHRRAGRLDAALALLGRVAVLRTGPQILVQLWQTLYEAQLRQAAAGADTTALRDRLLADGLYLPVTLAANHDAVTRSEQSTAAGYDALLADNPATAVALFHEALDAFPGNAHAHRGLGIAWARRHDHRRASGAYVLYLALRPFAADAEEVDRLLVRYWRRMR